jgi:membrane-associated phospholipid phosphatase
MPDLVTTATPWRMPSAIWAGVGAGALMVAAVLLWVHYGSAVFFEMIVAGFASCF